MNDLLNLASYALLAVLAVVVTLLFMFFLGVTKVLVLIAVGLILGALIGALLPASEASAKTSPTPRRSAAIINAIEPPSTGESMTALSIRNLDEKALQRLKAQAEAEGASVNSLVVRLIETATGVRGAQRGPAEHHDLDALAGTWNEAEAEAFERATAPFEQIDDALWR